MRSKKLLTTFVTSTLVLTGGVLVACGGPEEEAAPREPGPESGVYYNYDGGNGSRRALSLSDGDQASLEVDGANMSGTYAVDGNAIKLSLGEAGELDAMLDSDVITLTYNSEQLKFWKDIDYTVTYETFGGSVVSQANVKYGQVLVPPSAPTRGNDAFLGWTTVEYGETLYSFTENVSGDLTLYAKWVEATDNEYVISYDLGYGGATPIPSAQTAAGRAYNLPTPTRSGYTFKGWWVSQYNSAEKLSYRCNEGVTEFGADTTLYAKWQADGEANPDITVTSSGISWERTGAEVRVIVRGPQGYGNNGATDDRYGATGATSKSIDFTQAPAGDYEITLESGGNEYKVYYKNKSVNDVSRMRVRYNNQLEYSAVEGAEKYYVTVDCGTPGHDHVMIDNGSNTTYNFSACDMKPEGISFTVYAAAAGKAMSAGRTLVHEAHLAAVNSQSYELDAETGVLTWSAVENATSYEVSVNGGAPQEITATNYKINNYDGEVSVSVVPKGHGYNPGAAAVYSYTRTTLSTPKNLYIEGSTLKWTGDPQASEYEIKVGSVTLRSTATELDLNAADIEWQENQEYDISIRSLGANGANASYWSDKTSAAYNTTSSPVPRYSASTLNWAYAIGVEYYEVRINDGEVMRVSSNYLNDVILTQRGVNFIRLRSVTEAGPNEWSVLQVMAYELTFELNGETLGRYYKATGDKIELPNQVRVGYDFTGWRTASVNGAVYDQDTFTGTTNLTLHAAYTPHVYTVNLNYGSYGTAPNSQTTATIAYDSDSYALPVPNITDGRMQFIGWNTSSRGDGVSYADYKGDAVTAWNNANENVTIYAVYAEALTFTEDGDGYAVSAGREISKVTHLTIPATYNGKKVRSLGENAFRNCNGLVAVTIPSTVQAIPETAFDGCSIRQYKSTVIASDPDAVFEATADGVLLRRNYATGAVDLMFVPAQEGDTFRVPGGVTNLRSRVFNRLSVSEIIIPASVRTIEVDAFINCTNLTKVTFEDTAGESLAINPRAFNGCANIEELVLPGRLTAWGDNGDVASVLSNFVNLKKITVVGGNNNSAYSSDANGMLFSGNGDTLLYCPRKCELTEYVVPSTVLYIGDGAFGSVRVNANYESRQLTSITFHNQMRGIGEKAFYYNANLTSVTFAASATQGNGIVIGNEAFRGCSGLTTLDFQETGALGAGDAYVAATTCSVASIGDHAFSGMRAQTIVLPSTLTRIGDSAFSGNNRLSELDLGHINDALEFGTNVFSGNTSLTSVEITPNIGVIEFQTVFKGCNIKEYDVSNNSHYAVDEVVENGEVTGSVIYNSNYTQLVYIPDNVNMTKYQVRNTVTSLAGGIFSGRDDVTEFVVPAAVTSIGANAFQNCVNLTKIEFASSEEPLTIGEGAFIGCSSLTEISIPGRTTSMGSGAFERSGIQTVTFEEGVAKIPDRAFYMVDSLRTVTIASTVTEIGESAFYDTGVTTVTFTNAEQKPSDTSKYKVIKANAFANCESLQTIVLPEGLQYISESTFENCTSLTSVTVPTTVTNHDGQAGIGKAAFYECENLTTIEFTGSNDSTVTGDISFGEHSLYNTLALHVIDLPKRAAPMTSNDYDVFQTSSFNPGQIGVFRAKGQYGKDSYALQTITMGGKASESGEHFAISDSILYSKDFTTLVLCPEVYEGKTSASGKEHTVTIAKETTEIRQGAFKNCKLIENIEFEDATNTELAPFIIPDVDKNENEIFYGCVNLRSVAFPARLTSIGKKSFYKSSGNNQLPTITEISFAGGCRLQSIGDEAFTYSQFTSLVLPDSVVSIGNKAFAETSLTSITLSSDLQTIGIRAFYNSHLTSIDFEKCVNLKSIGAGAFTCNYQQNATLGGSVVLPDKLTDLGEGAFRYAKITSATVPSSLSSFSMDSETTLKITGAPFAGCNSLTSLTFGSNIDFEILKDILVGIPSNATLAPSDENGKYAVESDIIYSKGKHTVAVDEEYDVRTLIYCPQDYVSENLVIGADVVAIQEKAFSGRKGIAEITFASPAEGQPSFELTIGQEAFKGMNLESITLPERLTSLGANAFQDCKSLQTVELPATLAALQDYTFAGCIELITVSFGGSNSVLATIGSYAFDGCTSFKGTSENGFELPANVTTFGTKITLKGLQDKEIATSDYNGYVFRNCTSLENFIVPAIDKVTVISDHMFQGCTGLRFIGKISKISETEERTFGLPSTIKSIGVSAFENCKMLGNNMSVSLIPEDATSITYIGQYAFKNCQSLINIYIPNSIEAAKLGKRNDALNSGLTGLDASKSNATATTDVGVFYGCTSLETVTFGATSKITIIGMNAFKDCTHLKTVEIPKTVTTIGENAFRNCGSELPAGETLSVTFQASSGLTTICKAAFRGSALRSITLPSSLKYLGSTSKATVLTDSQVFMDCDRLTEIDMSACSNTNMVAIGQSTFSGCSSLATVKLNARIAGVGSHAFENCTSLESIKFENSSALTIKSNAFEGCSELKEVKLEGSKGVTFEKNAFSNGEEGTAHKGCPKLATISFGATAATQTITINDGAFNGCASNLVFGGSIQTISGGLYTVSGTNKVLIGYIGGEVDTFTVAEGTTEIKASALKGNRTIKNIIIPASVTSVGTSAFDGSSIVSVTFGYGAAEDAVAATEIGSTAFQNAKSLISVDLTGVKTIKGSAFKNAGVLPSEDGETRFDVVIPSSVTTIEGSAFEGSNVVNATINAAYAPTGNPTGKWFYNCKSLKTVTIGSGVTKIGGQAFYGCTSLVTVDMTGATNLEMIGYEFASGSSLSNGQAFYGCTSLNSISLPDKMTKIASATFQGCSSLSSVYLNNAGTIAPRAFDGCASNITFAKADSNNAIGLLSDNRAITVTKTEGNTTTVTLVYKAIDSQGILEVPNGVTELPAYAYYQNKSLMKVVLPSSVRTIGESAFEQCTYLTTVENMDKVTRFDPNAFNSAGLTSIALSTQEEVVLDRYVFSGCKSLSTFNGAEGKLTLGSNIKFAGTRGNQFDGCVGIKELELNTANGAYNATTGSNMFLNCTGLNKVTIGDNVDIIATSMFQGCSNIEGNIVMEGVTVIEGSAFSGVTKAHIYFDGNKVTKIGSSAFATTPATKRVHVVGLAKANRPNTWSGLSATANYVEWEATWPSTTTEAPEA